MLLRVLKRSVPTSLYARAALILILPVATLQLVVSVVFIQRHFAGVTEQMTRNVLAETLYIVARLEAEPDLGAAQHLARTLAPALQLSVEVPAAPVGGDLRAFYDLTGSVVIDILRGALPRVAGIDLVTDPRAVRLTLDSRHGPMLVRVPRSRVSASNPHQLLVWMIFTGILMTLISIQFLRLQVRPIRLLADAAEAFGKGRHEPYRPAGASEVRSAGKAFLDMRGRIERQIEQRTLMLSGVSHDLRTPLTRLKLALGMMDDTPDVLAMRGDVRDMERLVDEFLAFARGDALDDAVSSDLAALVSGVVAAAARSGQRVSFEPAGDIGPILIRPLAITRALENLINNAVRYGTCASVRLERLDGAVRLRVEDDGPGIPESRIDEALKPFSRLDPARNQNESAGVGLGLAIAADIARKHGGRLTLGRSARLGGLCADLVLAR